VYAKNIRLALKIIFSWDYRQNSINDLPIDISINIKATHEKRQKRKNQYISSVQNVIDIIRCYRYK